MLPSDSTSNVGGQSSQGGMIQSDSQSSMGSSVMVRIDSNAGGLSQTGSLQNLNGEHATNNRILQQQPAAGSATTFMNGEDYSDEDNSDDESVVHRVAAADSESQRDYEHEDSV